MDRRDAQAEYRLVGYSAGNFGKNLIWSAADVTLLFMLTDLVGLPAAQAATLMLIAMFGDLIFDLAAGGLITRLRANGYSYRSVLLMGTVPCGLSFGLLYMLPWLHIGRYPIVVFVLLVFRCSYAVIDVPHNAMLAAISQDSRARGRASGYRSFFSAVASLGVATVLAPLVNQAAARSASGLLAAVGLGAGMLFILSMLVVASAVGKNGEARARLSQSKALLPKADPLTLAMAAIALLTGLAIPMFGRTAIYFADYVVGSRAFAGHVLTAITAGLFPGVALWTWLVKRHDKTKLLIAAHLAAVCGIASFALALPHIDAMLACAVLIGAGQAGVYMLPWAILADVVDFAEYRHGDRREAATFATFLVLIKASGAGSIGMIGLVMGHLGYKPAMAQSQAVRDGIMMLSIGVPIAGSLIAIMVLGRLSIGHRAHALVSRRLHRRLTSGGRVMRS